MLGSGQNAKPGAGPFDHLNLHGNKQFRCGNAYPSKKKVVMHASIQAFGADSLCSPCCSWWLVLICCERKLLLVGWWLVLVWYERKILLASYSEQSVKSKPRCAMSICSDYLHGTSKRFWAKHISAPGDPMVLGKASMQSYLDYSKSIQASEGFRG